jgi:HAMP domain-containing protein
VREDDVTSSPPQNKRGGPANLTPWLAFVGVVIGSVVVAVIWNWNLERNSNRSPAAPSRESQISISTPTATQTELTETAVSPSVNSLTQAQPRWQVILDTVKGGPFLKSFMPTISVDKLPPGQIDDYSLQDILHAAKKLCGQIGDFRKLDLDEQLDNLVNRLETDCQLMVIRLEILTSPSENGTDARHESKLSGEVYASLSEEQKNYLWEADRARAEMLRHVIQASNALQMPNPNFAYEGWGTR